MFGCLHSVASADYLHLASRAVALLTEPAYRLANKTSNSTWGHIGAALRPPHVGASLLTRHTTPSLPLVASFLELVFEARRPPASPLVAVMVPGSGPSQRPTAVPSPLGLWCKNCFAVHRAATMPMFLEVFHGKRWQEWIISRMIWPWKLQVMTISTNPSMVLAPPRMPGRHCTVRGRWPFLMQKTMVSSLEASVSVEFVTKAVLESKTLLWSRVAGVPLAPWKKGSARCFGEQLDAKRFAKDQGGRVYNILQSLGAHVGPLPIHPWRVTYSRPQ